MPCTEVLAREASSISVRLKWGQPVVIGVRGVLEPFKYESQESVVEKITCLRQGYGREYGVLDSHPTLA